jgi:hypothetical protein
MIIRQLLGGSTIPFRICYSYLIPLVLVIVSLLVAAIVVRLVHPIVKVLHVADGIVEAVVDVLRDIFYLLHLLAAPPGSGFREVLDIVDGIVLRARPARRSIQRRFEGSWRRRCRIRRREFPCGTCRARDRPL